MYKLYVLNDKTKEEKVLKFETIELALLYRDYHLTFGTWSSVSKWVSAEEITDVQKLYIVDSKYIESNNKLKLFYKISEGFQIRIQKEDSGSIEEIWMVFRKKRDLRLTETDWTQVADSALTIDERKEYRSYRNYLRDLPLLHDNTTILGAKVYCFEDWKKGKR